MAKLLEDTSGGFDRAATARECKAKIVISGEPFRDLVGETIMIK